MTALTRDDRSSAAGSAASISTIRVIQHGPCWCRGGQTVPGSFDFMRTRSLDLAPGIFDRSLLIVSDRLIVGSEATVRRGLRGLPDPRLVVATGHCRAAEQFWSGLPGGWVKAAEVIPVDVQVAACFSGRPEELLAAVLTWKAENAAGPRAWQTAPG